MAQATGPKLLTIRETVAQKGATIWFWRNQIWSGRIPVFVVGRTQYLDERDIDQFIERNKKIELLEGNDNLT